MRRKSSFFYIAFICIILWCIIFQLSTFEGIIKSLNHLFAKFEAQIHLQNFFQVAPTLRDRLLLIDKKILTAYQESRLSTNRPCVLCSISRFQPVTFGLVTPVNRSLEEHILLPILRAWEGGFWVEQIVYSNFYKFSPIRLNLPLGFILLKEGGAIIIEIVLLHQREGDFWWHGSLDQDSDKTNKLKNLKLTDGRSALTLNSQGSFDKIRFESVTLDGLDFNIPRNVPHFLITPSLFLECNYERADRFYRMHGRDTSARANMFRHRVRKVLAVTKVILDGLKIPFWISSGTLLGYYRQCDVIPYSQDVDIGVMIDSYNASVIPAFTSRGLRLKHKFGRVNDGLEISFTSRAVKLDIFFFYKEDDYIWNGGHALVYENGKISSGVKYRYRFPKFTLCWTEFLEIKVRIPCETEAYITANYGPNWFTPVPKWHWYKDPFNVETAGVWTPEEVPEVLQVF